MDDLAVCNMGTILLWACVFPKFLAHSLMHMRRNSVNSASGLNTALTIICSDMIKGLKLWWFDVFLCYHVEKKVVTLWSWPLTFLTLTVFHILCITIFDNPTFIGYWVMSYRIWSHCVAVFKSPRMRRVTSRRRAKIVAHFWNLQPPISYSPMA